MTKYTMATPISAIAKGGKILKMMHCSLANYLYCSHHSLLHSELHWSFCPNAIAVTANVNEKTILFALCDREQCVVVP